MTEADWRGPLDALLGAGPDPRAEGAGTPLGLRFAPREHVPRTAHRWNGPTSKAVRPGSEPIGRIRLGVRPVVGTATGWATNGVTWSNLPHMLHRQALDPAQHRWACRFQAVHRAATDTWSQDADWAYLDDFDSALLWPLLDEAAALGVALVGERRGAEVRVEGAAVLGLDARRTAAGLALVPELRVGAALVDRGAARALGDHGVWWREGARAEHVRLAPLEAPLDPGRAALIGPDAVAGDGLLVPEGAADAFVAGELGELARRIPLTSADGSVAVPETRARLVVTAQWGARGTLGLSWRWEAARSGPVMLAPADVLAGLVPDDWLGDAGPGDVPPARRLKADEALDAARLLLPRLRALPDVLVEVRGDAPVGRVLEGAPELALSTAPTEDADWFSLALEVHVHGRRIPFGPLFRALAAGRRTMKLVDGTLLALDDPAFARLADLIAEGRALADWTPAGLRVGRHQTALWSDFEDLADSSSATTEWRALVAAVRDGPPAEMAAPAGVRAELRPYQRAGLAWLVHLHRHGLGGVLADDMGLGKTLQCLSLVQHVADVTPPAARRPFLVVAPTSVTTNWVDEAARFTPGLVVRRVASTEVAGGTPIAELAAGADVVVTSAALLRLDGDAVRAVAAAGGFAGLILDEAQQFKNPESMGHRLVAELAVPFRLAVTGTPLENSVADLRAVLQLVAPGLFPSARRFEEEYLRPIEGRRPGIASGPGAGEGPAAMAALRAARVARLRERIAPFLFRRTKEQVAADLPERLEQVLRVDLDEEHREQYDRVLARERQKVLRVLERRDEDRAVRFTVFRSLTLLRLTALDAALTDADWAGPGSAKLEALAEQAQEAVSGGHRVLVFSQFTRFLRRAEARLAADGVATVLLDGSTRDRPAVIDRFRRGEAPVFLISLRAGGTGLTLTEADVVILLDPWWNPAVERQAIDRAHRIGQARPVTVHRIIAADTIEEKVLALGARKRDVFDAVLGEGGGAADLDPDDVRALLG